MGQLQLLLGSNSWDLTSFLTNSTEQVKIWGGSFLTLVGVIGIIWSAFQIVTGLMSHGKKQVSYGTNAILLLISGALSATGLSLVTNIAQGGQKTIEDLGTISQFWRGVNLDASTIMFMIKNGLF